VIGPTSPCFRICLSCFDPRLPVCLPRLGNPRLTTTAELFRFDDMSLRTYLAGTDRGLATVT
jgi:hypothetical protein